MYKLKMPTMNNYLNFLYVNLGYIAQIAVMMYFKSALEIKENWPVYRCNPPYWVFSDDVSADFTYCVQNTQMNMMDYLLEPLNYMISALTSIGGELGDSVNGVRGMFSSIRDFVSNIVETIFGVFLNIIIEFQKIIISIKDMVGKMIGIVVTILYILDGSIKTMESTWNGPPGQIVQALGSCFHPQTKVELKNGEVYAMKDLPLGAELKNGSKVFSVMKIANLNNEPLYRIKGGENAHNPYIYVTGSHYIWDTTQQKWKQVKDVSYAERVIYKDNYEWFSCLITTNNKIPIDMHLFWDWEDDVLNI